MAQAGLNGWGGKGRMGTMGKSLEKETEEVCAVSSLLAVLFGLLTDKRLSRARPFEREKRWTVTPSWKGRTSTGMLYTVYAFSWHV